MPLVQVVPERVRLAGSRKGSIGRREKAQHVLLKRSLFNLDYTTGGNDTPSVSCTFEGQIL